MHSSSILSLSALPAQRKRPPLLPLLTQPQWYATEPALTATVAPYSLALTYPRGNASSIASLIVSAFKSRPTVTGWADLVGLRVNVSSETFDASNYTLTYAGRNGGDDEPINDFEFWNFTYTLPEDFEGVPSLRLDFELL